MTIFGSSALAPITADLRTERLETTDSPQDLFVKIQQEFETAFLLESAKGDSRLAEYSFIGFEPTIRLVAKDGGVAIDDERRGKDRLRTTDPIRILKRVVSQNRSQGPYRFVGGAVGYISYDSVHYWERVPRTSQDDLKFPDMEFGIYEDGIVYDHASGEVSYHSIGPDRLGEVKRVISIKTPKVRPIEPKVERISNVARNIYEEKVHAAKEYIRAGDIFQVVLSRRQDFQLSGDLTRFYRELSRINPSPYMYYLKFGDRRVIGSSPEMLLRLENGAIETYPIAGTRPRVADSTENARLTSELLADPKERAEHVMLVDLARNDVGKVAEYGSVTVPEFLTVQQYSHVQHIVSRVVGRLRPDRDSFDAMKALFPAGTLSGAPKPRAMEIIDELERSQRGPYGGAVGYFSFNGNADFAITIRTLVAEGDKCSVQAGAGIVADSDPAREWQETESKAQGLFKAVSAAMEDKTK